MTRTELAEWAGALEVRPPEDILAFAAERFPRRVTFATGFGREGCVLLDLIVRHGLDIDVFTLDTGVLFPETYAFWERLERHYGIAIRAARPSFTLEEAAAVHRLWETDPDRCCQLRKILPLRAALSGFGAWISAARRDQARARAGARAVEWDARFSLVKVSPLVAWSEEDVTGYVARHGVPVNPLHERGYPRIGCAPCTSPAAPGEDPLAGRWRGREKRERGVHVRHPWAAAGPSASISEE
jgi:phosphoadenylyl-sulfate reductase (thioredoxin)